MKLDVMPRNPAILGFSNRWYDGAIQSAADVELERGLVIRAVRGPYFPGASEFNALPGTRDFQDACPDTCFLIWQAGSEWA
ncbi:MAG TPA: hypothetical protein VKG79_10205 [Bryobacteraceae bacterium]|nr:hypothetical protein [Bryobacteraceae bacterium]